MVLLEIPSLILQILHAKIEVDNFKLVALFRFDYSTTLPTLVIIEIYAVIMRK